MNKDKYNRAVESLRALSEREHLTAHELVGSVIPDLLDVIEYAVRVCSSPATGGVVSDKGKAILRKMTHE